MYSSLRSSTLLLLLLCMVAGGLAQKKSRARDLGIPFDGIPGPWNAITDVAGVEVGYSTIIRGDGKLVAGKGPVRTGVTAIFPKGNSVTCQYNFSISFLTFAIPIYAMH